MNIDDLFLEVERIHNLTQTLTRSLEFQELDDSPNHPDLALAKHLDESLSKLLTNISAVNQITSETE